MLHRYSIIIHPNENIIELFKSYKEILFDTIGDFGSRNSLPHITILEFDATENELKSVIGKLVKITESEVSFRSVFNQVVYSTTVLVLPNRNEHFKKLLDKVRNRIKGEKNKSNAHLTIGRNLKPEQIEKSQNLFPSINFEFECNQLALRKLNPEIKQFEIMHIFPFNGKPNQGRFEQMTLDWDL